MKHIILMRGPSGSGKSTWIKNNHPDATVFSADHYFEKSGEYIFKLEELDKAHGACLRNFIVWCQRSDAGIAIVDNTNTTLLEMAPYVAAAKAFCGDNLKIEFIDLPIEEINAKLVPELCFGRNKHGVDLKTIKRQWNRLNQNRNIPKRWKISQ